MASPIDTMVLPPEFWKALAEHSGGERPNFLGMKVIQSPLARRTRRVPDRLQRSRTFPYSGYEMTYKEVHESVAFMFNTKALDFQRPLPPIFKRDLSTFQRADMGIVTNLTAAAS